MFVELFFIKSLVLQSSFNSSILSVFSKKNKSIYSKGVYRNKSWRGSAKFARRAKKIPPHLLGGGGQNLNCKFKTIGFMDIRHKYKIPSSKKTHSAFLLSSSRGELLCFTENGESSSFPPLLDSFGVNQKWNSCGIPFD